MDVYYKFKHLGFTKNETDAYLALLKLGTANLKDIENETSLHRANLIGALGRLQKKGALGISAIGKRKAYSPVEPKVLFGRLATDAKETGESLAAEIARIRPAADPSKVEIFSGPGGIKNILDDELEVGRTINSIQSSSNVEAVSGSYLGISRQKRWRKGMRMRIIYDSEDIAYAKKAALVPRTEARIAEKAIGDVTIDTYGDRGVLIFGEEPTVVKITNTATANAFLNLFGIMWKSSKPLG